MNSSVRQYLENDFTDPVRDPLWKHIYLSRPLLRVMEQKPFLTLGKIKQLGAAHLVYPGATHTRLNHSLGVFHLAKRIIRVLVSLPGARDVSLEGTRAFLAAALLHDVGHFPFTHSFKELPLEEHERLTARLVLSSPLKEVIRDHVKADPYTVAAIVDHSMDDRGEGEIGFFRNILSGVLDPDKLDYLNRDAYFCGVSYGVQDIDFIINRIRPHAERGISLEIGGLPAVENILFSKYLMYRTVYWHKTVRIATAMIKKAVYLGLKEGVVEQERFYGLDDESFFSFFTSVRFEPFELIRRVARRELYKSVYDMPFLEEDPVHRRLLDLDFRTRTEDAIADRLTGLTGKVIPPCAVILDIPEPISFEIDLPVESEGRYLSYPEAGTVFTRPVVEGFTRVLRKIRLIVPKEVASLIRNPEELLVWR